MAGNDEADVVLIGTGPAGAAAAWRLATQGLTVIMLERGDWQDYAGLDRNAADWELRRARDWNTNPNHRRHAADYPIDDSQSDIKPMLLNGVGGSSLMWSGHVPRYRRADFQLKTLHGVGDDWPIGYDDLEPYYALNERMIGISARPGDPKNPGSELVPRQQLPIGRIGTAMGAALDRLGWHWWPVVRTVGTFAAEAVVPCTHSGPCDFGCPSRQRASADHNYLPAAIAAGARIETRAHVTALEHDGANRIKAALVRAPDGTTRRIRADRFVLAGNGIASPHLLQRSASGRFPNGLANTSGQVGRNLMLHPTARVYGRFPESFAAWEEGPRGSILTYQFYGWGNGGEVPSSFVMQLSGGASPLETALGTLPGKPLPWGADHAAAFEQSFDHIAGFGICVDDLPQEGNRIVLSETLRDHDGGPAPQMLYRIDDLSRQTLEFAMDRATEVLKAGGADEIYPVPFRGEAGFHLMGTVRMGADPDSSVVDPFGRAHDVDNLWVVDSSVFVTGAAVNPTHTAQAIALRAADRLVATAQA